MSLQEKRTLWSRQEQTTRFCKIKILLPLVILGYVISTTINPSLGVSYQQVISMDSLMSTTALVGSSSSSTAHSISNPIHSWLTTTENRPPTVEDEDDEGDEGDEDNNNKVVEEETTEIPLYRESSAKTEAAATAISDHTTITTISDDLQCAICFFGLPRSYKELVLPSIVKHVLEPNAKYNCDIFVHFYARNKELKGRLNPGGEMDPKEIYALEGAVQQVMAATNSTKSSSSSSPAIIFSNDTERTFFDLRRKQIDKYLKTKDKTNGKKLYFPWKQKTWKRSSLVNLIRQWHSIETVFGLMEHYMTTVKKKNYTRVAMLRNDAMYLSPIDILKLDNDNGDKNDQQHNVDDVNNEHFVIAPFANYPVNDRMIYGPYEAIKIWATQRFNLVEQRAQNKANRGMVMHSETFMQQSILPAMEDLGYKQHVHPGLCFIRTRPDSKALYNDCRTQGMAKGFEKKSAVISEINNILGRSCEPAVGKKGNSANLLIQC
mmetsp:Transcript_22280/g.55032  ORF Transcript_22280/g.55032 Transcript_22280/m.55032 type:complete len:491 (-) Transcript_22280:448-1920(-)